MIVDEINKLDVLQHLATIIIKNHKTSKYAPELNYYQFKERKTKRVKQATAIFYD